MDAAGDADYAIYGHRDLPSDMEHDPGLLYLAHFGFVQALYLQEKAVQGICLALGYSDLADQVQSAVATIRSRRNDIVHLTDRGGKRFLGIVRISLTPASLELYEFGSSLNREQVSTAELARAQREQLVPILELVVTRLSDADHAHRAQFRAERLAQHLDPAKDAQRELAETIVLLYKGASPQDSCDSALTAIENSLAALAESLRRRDLYPGVLEVTDHRLERARAGVQRLRDLVRNPPRERIDVLAQLALVASDLRALAESAEELDASYADTTQPQLRARTADSQLILAAGRSSGRGTFSRRAVRKESRLLSELIAKTSYPLEKLTEGVRALHGQGEVFRITIGNSAIGWISETLGLFETTAQRHRMPNVNRVMIAASIELVREALSRLEAHFGSCPRNPIDSEALVELVAISLKHLRKQAAMLE